MSVKLKTKKKGRSIMIIKYFHTSEPDVEKTYDTVKSLKNNPFFHLTQEEFDKMEIDKMKNDVHIISYKVMGG